MAANLCVSNLMDCLLNKSSENVPSTNSGAFSEMVLFFADDLTYGVKCLTLSFLMIYLSASRLSSGVARVHTSRLSSAGSSLASSSSGLSSSYESETQPRRTPLPFSWIVSDGEPPQTREWAHYSDSKEGSNTAHHGYW